MSLPAIAAVRKGAPAATLVVFARPTVAPLFRMAGGIDDVVTDESLIQQKHEGSLSTAILLTNSFRSALVARRARIPERWGYRTDWRGPLLTRAMSRPRAGAHQVERYRLLVDAFGFPSTPSQPKLSVDAEIRNTAACVLQRAGWDGRTPVVAVAPGAAYGGSRRWPAERFAAVARSLADEGMQPVLIGSAADAPTGRAVQAEIGGTATVVNLVGETDLPTLAGVLAHARALVSNDSGAMHLGAAVGVPVTAILGPTDERVTGPRGASSPVTVLQHPVWCSPCRFRECPIGHRCMRGVSVEAVTGAVRQMQ